MIKNLLALFVILISGCASADSQNAQEVPVAKEQSAQKQSAQKQTVQKLAAPASKALSDINGWEIRSGDSGLLAKHSALENVEFELEMYSGFPKIKEWKMLANPNYYLLVYEAGGMGTSHTVIVWKAKVINIITKTELLDEIWQYKDLEGKPDKQVTDPEWTFTKSKIFIKSSSSSKPDIYSLN